MSICIPLTLLKLDQLNELIKILTFKKISAGRAGDSIFINFYESDQHGNMKVPFYYGCGIFNSNPNLQRPISPISMFTREQILNSVEWREHQDVMMAEILKYLDSQHCCIIATPPGSGKTLFATISACIYNMPTLVLCPQRGLIKQWAKTITTFTPYGFIVDSGAFKDLLTEESRIASMRKPIAFIIYTPGMIDKIPAHILDNVGTLVVDEAHEFCTPDSIHSLLATRPHKVILCSATPYRNSDGLEKVMYFLGSQAKINKVPFKPYQVFSLKTGWHFPEKYNQRYLWGKLCKVVDFSALQKVIGESVRYLSLLYFFTINLATLGRKMIVLSKQLNLLRNLGSLYQSQGVPYSSYYGAGAVQFSENQILLAGVDKGGTGFDEATFCDKFSGFGINTVILASSIKYCGLLFQIIGRGLRGEDPWVIQIIHANKIFANHAKERQCLFAATNGKTDINFNIQPELMSYLETLQL